MAGRSLCRLVCLTLAVAAGFSGHASPASATSTVQTLPAQSITRTSAEIRGSFTTDAWGTWWFEFGTTTAYGTQLGNFGFSPGGATPGLTPSNLAPTRSITTGSSSGRAPSVAPTSTTTAPTRASARSPRRRRSSGRPAHTCGTRASARRSPSESTPGGSRRRSGSSTARQPPSGSRRRPNLPGQGKSGSSSWPR
jgi:hypothetical protein